MAGWKRASFSPLRGGARVELAADSFTHMPSKRPWKRASFADEWMKREVKASISHHLCLDWRVLPPPGLLCLLYPCAASSYLRVLLHDLYLFSNLLSWTLDLSLLELLNYYLIYFFGICCIYMQQLPNYGPILILSCACLLFFSGCYVAVVYIIEIQSFLYFPCPFLIYILAINPWSASWIYILFSSKKRSHSFNLLYLCVDLTGQDRIHTSMHRLCKFLLCIFLWSVEEGGVHCCGLGLNTMLAFLVVWESVWNHIRFVSCNSETSFDLPVCFGTLHATTS